MRIKKEIVRIDVFDDRSPGEGLYRVITGGSLIQENDYQWFQPGYR